MNIGQTDRIQIRNVACLGIKDIFAPEERTKTSFGKSDCRWQFNGHVLGTAGNQQPGAGGFRDSESGRRQRIYREMTRRIAEAGLSGARRRLSPRQSEAAILISPIRAISSVVRMYRRQRPRRGTKTAQHRLDRRLELDLTARSRGDGARLFRKRRAQAALYSVSRHQ